MTAPLTLPQIGRDQFLLHNSLLGKSRQVPVQLGGQSLSFALQPLDASAVPVSGSRLVLGTGAHTFTVLVSHLQAFQAMEALLGDAELQSIPTSILSAMVEVCFEPALGWLRDALGTSLELETVEHEVSWEIPQQGSSYRFAVSSDEKFISHILMTIPAELLELSHSLLERMPVIASRSLADVTIPVSVVCGSVELGLDDLASLHPEDLLILDHFESEDTGSALLAGGCEVGRAVLKPGSAEVVEVARLPFQSRANPLREAGRSAGAPTILVDVVLAQGRLRLQELAQLQQHTDIPVQRLVNDRVSLWSSANPIGQGSLVSLGNGIAVRVQSFQAPMGPDVPAVA